MDETFNIYNYKRHGHFVPRTVDAQYGGTRMVHVHMYIYVYIYIYIYMHIMSENDTNTFEPRDMTGDAEYACCSG